MTEEEIREKLKEINESYRSLGEREKELRNQLTLLSMPKVERFLKKYIKITENNKEKSEKLAFITEFDFSSLKWRDDDGCFNCKGFCYYYDNLGEISFFEIRSINREEVMSRGRFTCTILSEREYKNSVKEVFEKIKKKYVK